jgi:OOP family OmpA-OmpF porin
MLLGAATGAVFSGAAACGAAAAVGSSNPNAVAIACPVGIVGGALVGGAIGYLTAYSEALKESQVPPPPPVMAQQSAELAQQQPAAPPPAAAEAPPPAVTQIPALPTPSPTPSATPSSTPAPTSPPPTATPVAVMPTHAPVISTTTPPTPTAVAPIPAAAPTPSIVAPETVELRGVFFRSKSWDLGNAQKRILDAAVSTLKQHPNVRIYVKGYSDSRGSTQLNQKLSQERAASVAAYLASKGIPLSHMIVLGMGSTHPLASNATAAGRALNRRVELEPILDEP